MFTKIWSAKSDQICIAVTFECVKRKRYDMSKLPLGICLLVLWSSGISALRLGNIRTTVKGAGSSIHSKNRNGIRLNFSTTAKGAGSVIAENRNSGFEYEFFESYLAGVVLTGTEVKSCRRGGVQLSDGLAEVREGEMWLLNVHISPHDRASSMTQHAPKRVRKLLLRHSEILKIQQRVLQRNMEIIPIRMYFSEKNFVKIELGVGTKKSLQDKRDDVMKRDGEREIRRVMKGFSGGD